MTERILITGAAGFIGSNLADTLLSSGFTVLGIDNYDPFYSRRIKEANISAALGNVSYSFKEGDIRDKEFIDNCLGEFNPEIIIHLAARAGVRPSLENPLAYYDVNVIGTLNLLEMMRKHNIRKMLFASSSSVYGNNTKIPFSESDIVDFPISPYAASKKAGELLCHTYHHLYDMDIFCLRFFTVYGPRQRPDLAIRKFTGALLEGRDISVFGDGSSSRDYTYIDDIVDGVVKAAGKVEGFEIFNLGESKPVSLQDLVSILEKASSKKARINRLPMEQGDVMHTYADISKARIMLGYSPVIDIVDGINKYLRWYTASAQVYQTVS